MQSTKSRQRDDLARARDRRGSNSTTGRVLPESEMSPVFVVIADVFFQQSSQVPLVQNYHVVEQLSTHTPNPTLGDAVLPGSAISSSDRFRAMLFDGRDDVGGELRIPVENQESMWRRESSGRPLGSHPKDFTSGSCAAPLKLGPPGSSDSDRASNRC